MQEPQLVGAYGRKGAATDGGGASSDEVKELRALVEQQSRQIRTLARLTGSLGPVELAGEPHHEVNDVDPKKFGNTESLKHGLTKFYIEKPFKELEEEMKEEGGEIRLPNSIYTVAICAGFFCDGNVWDAIEAHTRKLALLAAKTATLGVVDGTGDEEKGNEKPTVADGMSTKEIALGTVKNVWLMFVNAFVLLAFHYWLTFSVLYYLYVHPYESDPYPWDDVSDAIRMEARNSTHPWDWGTAWDSHFVQGECPTDIWLRGICASLFACFVYFDMLQTITIMQWLYWAPQNKQAIAAGRPTSWFFPDELKIRIIPSPFTGRGGEAPEREIESRIPLVYRWFMFVVVIIPKVIVGISLLFFGGKLVLRSENNPEVIMNSLAAYFVAEMDEYVYTYLCPSAIQKVLEDEDTFPPLNKKLPLIDVLPDARKEEEIFRERKQLMEDAIATFDKFDEDQDGELDEEELDQMFTQCGITLSTPQCRQVIAYCDADRNGTVSLRELRWLLTAKENVAETLDFNDPPDVKRWLQKEFMPQDLEALGWKKFWQELTKSLAPIFRIVTILLLTLILVVNYCDDLNPMDSLRAKYDASSNATGGAD